MIYVPLIFFSIGFFYYLIIPFFVKAAHAFSNDFPMLSSSYSYLKSFDFNVLYWLFLGFFIFAFVLGYCLRIRYSSVDSGHGVFDLIEAEVSIRIVTTLLSFIFVLNIYLIDLNIFFSGYDKFDNFSLGLLSSSCLLFSFFNLYYVGRARYLISFYMLFSILFLLGAGSRNIAFICLCATFISYLHVNKARVILAIAFFTLVPLLFILIGIWRLGYEFDISSVFSHFIADSVFTFSSYANYLMSDFVGGFNSFFSGELFLFLLSCVPSIFWPEKALYIQSYLDSVYPIAPFGGQSALVWMNASFGYFSVLCVFYLGFYVGGLYLRRFMTRFSFSVYMHFLPMLVVHVFNQHLFAVLKIVFMNLYLYPFVLLAIAKIISSKRFIGS